MFSSIFIIIETAGFDESYLAPSLLYKQRKQQDAGKYAQAALVCVYLPLGARPT